jgi:cold shock protein
MSERISGRIKWYNPEKGYGVILGDDRQEYFLHVYNLPAGTTELADWTRVTFKVRRRPRQKGGFEAIKVQIILPDAPMDTGNPPILQAPFH